MRRSNLGIIADTLSLCEKPQTQTSIKVKMNMSLSKVRDCILELQSRGLLQEVHHSSTRYVATEKGRNLIKKWKDLIELLSFSD